MDASKQQPAPVMNRTRIKEETKLVLEAFLKRSLSQEGPSVGHVGRVYHDHTKYSSRSSPKGHRNGSLKHHGRSLERNGCAHIVGENEECKGIYKSGSWRSIHEEINRAEESKHGFKTGIKRLLRRHSQTKEKSHPHKLKGGETPSKSRDSLDGVLEESQIGPGRGDSLKRPKTPNLFLACAVAPSDPFDPQEQSMYVAATEKSSSQGASRKSGKSFSLKKLFKMKHSAKDTDKGLPHANRPRTLSVQHCYEEAHPERLPTDFDYFDSLPRRVPVYAAKWSFNPTMKPCRASSLSIYLTLTSSEPIRPPAITFIYTRNGARLRFNGARSRFISQQLVLLTSSELLHSPAITFIYTHMALGHADPLCCSASLM
ncbi:bcl-2-like protein 12 isoform X3 [Ambystoma mexicanum]|uniref:bcl-2-like protein 12 isoform X3 n=1 Tax=Ambystoma mexicanum TaxID=8296 RepID=UPI0037E90D50